MQTTIT